MKLKINKTCDLNSISVLPPHARRSSMLPAQQPRSQLSQQSFSQGTSQSALFSQISQNSFDEQRFGSQEKDNSVKRISCLAPVSYPRDESQMPISRSSANMTRRWSAAAAAAPDQKCQLSEEVEHKFGTIETLLSRLGMIVDSIQADIMQVNKGMKEQSLAVEGIRQKSIAHDDSLHQLTRGEDELKFTLDTSLRTISNQLSSILHEKMQEIVAVVMKMQDQKKSDELSTSLSGELQACQDELKFTLDANLRTISNQLSSISHHEKMQEILATVMNMRDQIQASVQKKSDELSTSLCRELQKILYCLKTLDHKQPPRAILPRKVTGADSSSLKPIFERKPEPMKISKQAKLAPKIETKGWTTVKPELVVSNRYGNSCRNLKQRRFSPLATKQNVFVSLDDESDEDFSCFIVEKESGNDMVSEVDEEIERILRRARMRKRKQSCKR